MLMLRPFIKYADFNGRARRLEYCLFQLFQCMVYIGLITMIVFGVVSAAAQRDIGAAFGSLGLLMLMAVFALACFLPNLALIVRRLHDTGRSAWWLLLCAPSALSAASNMQNLAALGMGMGQNREALMAAVSQASILGVVGTICNLVMFVFMMLPGTPGSNRYGDNPKGGGVADIARIFDAPEIEEPAHTEAYKPIFDFGPATATASASPVRDVPAAPQPRIMPTPAAPARPTFGKKR